MPHLGPWEIVAIVAVVLIIFGVGRLPNALGALGKGVRSFRRAAAGEEVDTDLSKKEKDTAGEKDTADEQKS
ncbi:MAG: twin-arginine translocase TatA/TatE family subunit [Dehalococcoidia bacterium]